MNMKKSQYLVKKDGFENKKKENSNKYEITFYVLYI